MEDAIVNPVRNRQTPELGPCAFMISAGPDMDTLVRLRGAGDLKRRSLYMSRLVVEPGDDGIAIAGPVLGAPYAAMILENLAAWGVRQVVYMGWCGSLTPDLSIGDILIPSHAFVDEGTSRHYNGRWETEADSGIGKAPVSSRHAPRTADAIRQVLNEQGTAFREGPVWTTDGVFRETARKADFYRANGALAVEMEISALFTVGACRGLEVGAVVVVSDDLSTHTWRPGFTHESFKTGREKVLGGLKDLADAWRKGAHQE